MTSEATLDVRGLSCPEPALQTRTELQRLGAGTLVVLSDSATARLNVERVGTQLGWRCQIEQTADATFRITLRK